MGIADHMPFPSRTRGCLTGIQHDDAVATVQRPDTTSCDTCEALVGLITASRAILETVAGLWRDGNLYELRLLARCRASRIAAPTGGVLTATKRKPRF
jgi:hypothetical protein